MNYIYNEYPSILDLGNDIYQYIPMRYSITVPIKVPENRRRKGFDRMCMMMIDYMNVSYNNILHAKFKDIKLVHSVCLTTLGLTDRDVPAFNIETAKSHIMYMINLIFVVFNELVRVILEHNYVPFRTIFPELEFTSILEMYTPKDHVPNKNYFKLTSAIFAHLKTIFKYISDFVNNLETGMNTEPPNFKLALKIQQNIHASKPDLQFTHGIIAGATASDTSKFIEIIDTLNASYNVVLIDTIITCSYRIEEPYFLRTQSRGGTKRYKRKSFRRTILSSST